MSEERIERRLAAILAGDIAGYSRLMGVDEEGTLERLKALRRELVDLKIQEYRGRIVKTTGDGILVEFASVVDAVRCAVDVQCELTTRNSSIAAERRLEFRMGINVGDIIIDDGDIFGDGVNVAARLEALALPGGIIVSGAAWDQIDGKLPYDFTDLGPLELKNIARPIRAYALNPEATGNPPARSVAATGTAPKSSIPRLSIVVLPFTNLSADTEQQYFADGITEDLTTDLSRIAGESTGDRLFVISRNTAFTYKDKSVDVKQVGRELGVRYALEGSVQRSGSRVRITTQLIDAETGGHLWAQRFERDTGDLFALQSEITGQIAATLSLELATVEAARPAPHPEAMDYVFRARAARNKGPGRDTYEEAIGLMDQALTFDANSVDLLSGLVQLLAGRVMNGVGDDDAADLERAEALLERAMARSPGNLQVRCARALLLKAQKRWDQAIAEFEMVLANDPNSVLALANMGQCKVGVGAFEEAITLMEQVIRLSPRDLYNGNRYFTIGFAHLAQSRIDDAIVYLEKGRDLSPNVGFSHAGLAAAYGLKGYTELAADELAEAQRLRPDGRFSSITRLKDEGYYAGGGPQLRALLESTFFEGLRRAGLCEE